jgi:hypothetical protein
MSDFALNWGKLYRNIQNVENYVLESRQQKERIYEWFLNLKSSVTSVDDAECSGHPSVHKTDENVNRLKELLHENRRITVCEVAKMLGISYELVQIILNGSPYMCRIVAKFMLCLLSKDQKDNHVTTCQDLQESLEKDPEFLLEVIIGDEMWVYGCDPDTKQQ